MASPSKTQGTSVLSLQSVATANVVASSAVDVSTKFAGTMMIHFGRRATAALTAAVIFRIEASAKSSGDGFWFPLYQWSSQTVAANSITPSGTNASGQNVITTTTTAGAIGDLVYIDNTTIANSEFQRVKAISANTSITLEDNLANAQNNGSATVYNKAEWWAIPLDLSAIGRIRLVVDTASGPSGQNIAVEAFVVTEDSVA